MDRSQFMNQIRNKKISGELSADAAALTITILGFEDGVQPGAEELAQHLGWDKERTEAALREVQEKKNAEG